MKDPAGVLLDLDGTLLDTAPALLACVDELLAEHGRPPAAPARLRATASHGARAMVCEAFAVDRASPEAAALERTLLERYQRRLAQPQADSLFPGMAAVLDELERRGLPWGIVTNRQQRLTEPLLEHLAPRHRPAVVVCGDTLPRAKPHPDPMRHALRALGAAAEHTLTVGDARRDIEAALSVGAQALVALFGYLHAGDRPTRWGAHGLVRAPEEILGWLPAAR